jgi:two-component system sensor histidine kinase HydH
VLLLEDVRTAQARIRQEKLAAMGRVSAGIAHEIRNPLNAVGGFGDLLAQRLPTGSKERHWASLISAGVVEANRIITGLLHFARPGEIALSSLELRPLLEELIQHSANHPAHAQGVTIELKCPELTVLADEQKLRQALRNLLENALDWSPPGGRVRLTAWRSGAEMAVSVEDSGPGVAPGDAARLFEPFFTTRPEGTGLGLALAHTIAELHQGRLTVDPHHSELGGARFLFRWLTTRETPPTRAGQAGNPLPATHLQ